MPRVSVVERSRDAKLSAGGQVSATWAPQTTCPQDCPLLDAGCYAEVGHAGFTTRRLNANVGTASPEALALEEAELIVDTLSGTRKLRVHVVGDCATPEAATTIAMAMELHEQKHGQPAWTYTHAWRDVPKDAWLDARVLASVHSVAEADDARHRGYATALTTPAHPSNKLYAIGGLTVVPCPAQFKYGGTRVVTCEHCTLCQSPEVLQAEGLVVGFEPDHGTRAKILTLLETTACVS